MTFRVARWIVVAVGVALVVLAIAAAATSRTETLRQLVISTLSERLDSDIELQAFSVDAFPTVSIRGEGLVVRHRGRTDVPPLLSIGSFSVEGGVVGLIRRPRRFRAVHVRDVEINIPPGGLGRDKTEEREEPTDWSRAPIIVERMIMTDAKLFIIPRRKDKEPRLFEIQRLEMASLGAAQQIPFTAELTNPVPRGQIQTRGTFGPFNSREPGSTPLGGEYTFEDADLSTIDGIGGMLDSTGEFAGTLDRIAVKGETRTPDFRVNISGQPVPLNTRFEAVVDGTDGDTHLDDVHAEFLQTSLHAKGAVTGTPGAKGRTVALQVRITEGRIEDLLRLAVKSDQPPMVGRVALDTEFALPPGRGDVVDRLRLSGAFDLDAARFTDRDVQSKLSGMSRRARGEDPDEKVENVISDLDGRFRLNGGVLSLSNLSFAVPGATVRLQGTYGLRSEELAFNGTLRMDATVSEAAGGGGVKSFFLKLADPLFRTRNAGAVVPIKVSGTRSDPKFGLDVRKALTGKKD